MKKIWNYIVYLFSSKQKQETFISYKYNTRIVTKTDKKGKKTIEFDGFRIW